MTGAELLSSIDQITSAVRSGEATAVGVLESAVERIDAAEPVINAFIEVTRATARADAERVDAMLRRGHDPGPLAGVPVAVKDVFDLAGYSTTAGSPLLAERRAERDSDVVRRLRAAGAVVVGKTNLDEFAFGPNQDWFGRTNLPQDPTRYAGGSSAGSAAAVAEGSVPVAIGTDAGGSVRYPAACCGVVGFKPTHGCFDLTGAFPSFPSLDHLGILATRVADVTTLAAVLDPSLPPPIRLRRPPLIAIPRGWDERCDAVVGQRFGGVLEALQSSGTRFIPVELPDEDGVFASLLTTVAAEAVEELAAVIGRSRSTQIGRAVRTILAAGRAVTPADYEAAQRLRAVWRADVDRLLTQADAILTPTIARPALRWSDPDLHDWRIARFLPLFNLTGHPAMSLPVPTDSLPIGAQLVGRRDQDVVLLGLARWVESQLR